MDNELIRRWNERVGEEDTVIHLGDFCFRNSPGGKTGEGSQNKSDYYINKLNGRIVIVRGNHDSNNSTKSNITGLELEFGKVRFWATHRPDNCSFFHKVNLVGHVHEKWLYRKYWDTSSMRDTILINVGVDQHNFYPIKMTEVLKLLHRIKRNDK